MILKQSRINFVVFKISYNEFPFKIKITIRPQFSLDKIFIARVTNIFDLLLYIAFVLTIYQFVILLNHCNF